VAAVEGYTAQTYGEAIADVYDDWLGVRAYGQADAAAEFLAAETGAAPALELGIGTGRVALPLAARGVTVHGIDASPRMVQRLRAKPGGENLHVTVGDITEVNVRVPGGFGLVYVVASTLFCLTTQAAQVRCLRTAAGRLRPDGRLVVEAFVPDMTRFDRGQRVEARQVDAEQVRLDVSRHDWAAQTITSQQVVLDPAGVRLFPVYLRYIWPSELDLMCQLAGLRLVDRFAGWRREPFTADSGVHVSVYALANA
jgi:SAM-dependent methyltransferase